MKIVTAFTVAHSITLSLAALGLVHVPARIVEPLIAASIVWVAVENLVAPGGVGRRWLIAAAFGLVHGLGFASALIELDLSRETLVRALIGFNVGVELGQLAFVAVVMPPLAWASRPGRLPRLPQILSVARGRGRRRLAGRTPSRRMRRGCNLPTPSILCRGDEIDRLLPAGGCVDRFRRGARHQHRPGDARS